MKLHEEKQIKKQTAKRRRKLMLAIVLAVTLIVTLIPTGAFAGNTNIGRLSSEGAVQTPENEGTGEETATPDQNPPPRYQI